MLMFVVDRVGSGGSKVSVDDELLLIHRQMEHSFFSLLERLYPLKYEKADKQKLVCDGCELGKYIRSSYVSSESRISHTFDLIHSDVWGSCSTTEIDGHSFLLFLLIVIFVPHGCT
jgi:hypothetical protein